MGLLLVMEPAGAHSFGPVYTLPVPFWLYAWAAAATLIVSFVVAAMFLTRPVPGNEAPEHAWREVPRRLCVALQAVALFALLLSVATGLAGTPSVYANFNMTCFWVLFVLGLTYGTALIGDVYAIANPWKTLGRLVERAWPGFTRGRVGYPPSAGYWPALVLYAAFIVLELFGRTTPFSLSIALIAYSAINVLAVGVVGEGRWFRSGEMFSVLLRQVGRLAPLEYRAGEGGRVEWRWRRPLSGLLEGPREHPTLLLFVLLLLSATAFDGLHEARPWVRLFWNHVYPAVMEPLGLSLYTRAPELMSAYRAWQIGCLLLSPLAYAAAFFAAIVLMRELTGRRVAARELALRFYPSLLPIVLAYHVTHYYTLLLGQGVRIVPILSDPFGFGWNLFGTAQWLRGAYVPDLVLTWHLQVALILAGHVVSVAIAHAEALRVFGDRRRATLSQLPMLALMVAFTVAGLWILSLPFDPGPLRYGG